MNKVGEFKSADLTKAVSTIMAAFTGEDGGAAFVGFCTILRHMDNQALAGDKPAKQVTDVVRQFAKLIELGAK